MQGHLKPTPKEPTLCVRSHSFSAQDPGAWYTVEDPDCMVIDPEAQHPSATWTQQLPYQLCHCWWDCQQKNNYITKTVNFNTLHILLLCSYFLVSSTCIDLQVSIMVQL